MSSWLRDKVGTGLNQMASAAAAGASAVQQGAAAAMTAGASMTAEPQRQGSNGRWSIEVMPNPETQTLDVKLVDKKRSKKNESKSKNAKKDVEEGKNSVQGSAAGEEENWAIAWPPTVLLNVVHRHFFLVIVALLVQQQQRRVHAEERAHWKREVAGHPMRRWLVVRRSVAVKPDCTCAQQAERPTKTKKHEARSDKQEKAAPSNKQARKQKTKQRGESWTKQRSERRDKREKATTRSRFAFHYMRAPWISFEHKRESSGL